MLMEYFTLVGVGLVVLLPVANPLTSVSLLLALSAGYSKQERDRQVDRATLYVAAVLLICFYAGNAILAGLGISIPGLRIAGGLILVYIGFTMLFPGAQHAEAEAQKDMAPEAPVVQLDSVLEARHPKVRDISFVPLALPGTTGPGTIATIISISSTLHAHGGVDVIHHFVALTVTALLALLFWVCLRSAQTVMKFLGESGIDAVSRIMGFLLICMGVQFGIDGIFELISKPPAVSFPRD